MPKSSVITELDGQRLKLSNLEKILFPQANISKAELIQYSINMADYLLKYSASRPLTLVRFPDGIMAKKFYTKNRPSWTPDWMPSTHLRDEDENDYLLAKQPVHLVWLSNLAAIEIHASNSKLGQLPYPDHFIVDLDPPDGADFSMVKSVAFRLKQFLEQNAYNPYAMLSGGKGIHIRVPIRAVYTYSQLTSGVKRLMKQFIRSNRDCTLAVHKEKRKDKMLLDIYRNHVANTAIIPYSIRARPLAPVALPIHWKHLCECQSARAYKISDVEEYIAKHGDALADFDLRATTLYGFESESTSENELHVYQHKRDFEASPEPMPMAGADPEVNGRFVLQLHDASTLHYDLRLGINGVLKSWAIPKGLPTQLDIKRLAIQTEDHPAKYIDFEGTIPKNEYGGGMMWLVDQGQFEISQMTDEKLTFTLSGKYVKGKFTLFKTQDQQWLIKRRTQPTKLAREIKYEPMLCHSTKKLPKPREKFSYEIKWDGLRVGVYKQNGELKIYSRSGRGLNKAFPELTDADWIHAEEAIIDAELVCLNEHGIPLFSDVIARMHSTDSSKIQKLIKSKSAYLYCFDIIRLDGFDLSKKALTRRQEWLAAIVKTSDKIRLSEVFDDGAGLLEAAKALRLEGIIIKRKDSIYSMGNRTSNWLKYKYRDEITCTIIGYTKGNGDRASLFGALHLAIYDQGNIKYYGKVGSGFDHSKMKDIWTRISVLSHIAKPIEEVVDKEADTIWIDPCYECDIDFASLSSNGTLREPVFRTMRHK